MSHANDAFQHPPTLTGARVLLEPLTAAHLPALAEAIRSGELWMHPLTPVPHPDELAAWCDDLLAERAAERALPFVVVDTTSGRVAGATSYLAMALEHGRVEIGGTFLAPEFQRTHVNSEAKLLLLDHAFDVLGCNRVEFKTDARNAASRAAIARLGAQEEGTLRAHMVMRDGRLRDSVYSSILATEWPRLRMELRARIAAHD
ncbi:MAG: N-acetyltransferase [Thermoleophilia bacterium]|nr:N-acetyltransferase [Thermoleophilia bacterium]